MTAPLASNGHPELPRLIARVKQAARRLKRRLPAHVDVDDLISAGYLGLAQALASFEGTEAHALEAYALQRATGAMLDELRSQDQLTRSQRKLAGRIGAAERALGQELGRRPESEELAAKVGMTTDDLATARAKTLRYDRVSLGGFESRAPVSSSLAAPDKALEEAQSALRVQRAVDALPERLRTIVDLGCSQDLTLRQIGDLLGVTEARICQLRKQALTKLKERCADTILPPPTAHAA